MKQFTLVKLIDVIAFIGFVFLLSTGTLMHYVLPAGTGRWTTIWGLDRHDWGNVHFYVAVFFLSIISFHLYLHRQFISNLFRGEHKEGSGLRFGLGLTGLIALILLAIAPLLSPIETDSTKQSGKHFGNPDKTLQSKNPDHPNYLKK